MSLAALRHSRAKQLKEAERQTLLAKREELAAKSVELEQSVNEAETDEDMALIDAEIQSHEAAVADNEAAIEKLDGEITELDKAINEANERAQAAIKTSASSAERSADKETGGFTRMSRRYKHNMTPERREAYLRRDEVKDFYERVRGLMGQKRAVTGVDLLVPEVTMELLRDNMGEYSKLIKHVNVKPVKGFARQNVIGEVPEAVWTEMKGALNELEFDFSKFELDGYKVGGYIPVPNSSLNDSMENLAAEVEHMLSEAIGYALDKAIIYGKGAGYKMPTGFVTGLVENNLKGNIIKIDGTAKTGVDLFKEILRGVGQMKARLVRNPITFLMNQQTWNALVMPESLAVNAAGALVAASNNSFPALGGAVEFLDFIPYGDIVGGYLEKYLLVEREGSTLNVSEHVRFIEDQTVFRGIARYDGVPVRPAAFFAMNITNAAPTTSMSFVLEKDNPEALETDDQEDDESGN